MVSLVSRLFRTNRLNSSVGRRAFPSMMEKEFDRLLKGRFFQALMVKWQRNLEAPKPGETFLELYSRTLMLEQVEKQYAAIASAAAHSDQAVKRGDRERPSRVTPTSSQLTQDASDKIGKPIHARSLVPEIVAEE